MTNLLSARRSVVRLRAQIRGLTIDGFYGRCLRAGDLAFDIGANMGLHTSAMLRAGASVVAVEPQSRLAEQLRTTTAATVVQAGVSDQTGEATLMKAGDMTGLATLNPAWPASYDEKVRECDWKPASWSQEETITLTTLDELISCHGVPALAKIDVEGLEDKVLAGLSQPIKHLLFEVHSGMPEVARRAFEHVAHLGSYELRVMEYDDWTFQKPTTAEDILAQLPDYGDVHARLR